MFNDNYVSFPKINLDIEINPVLIQIGNFKIYWYGVLIAIGFLLALIYGLRNCKRFRMDSDHMIDCVIGGVIGGIIGARLYYVLFNLDIYLADPKQIFFINEGGLAIYGGIIGALLLGGVMCKIRKVKMSCMFDLAGIGFLIGQAVGRWGNFVNQEAFGTNTNLPWGMQLSSQRISQIQYQYAGIEGFDITQPVHPCFLYESLWCIVGFVLLHIISKKFRKFDGQIFFMYIGWYGLGRVWIEGLRTDSLMLGPVRISQLVAGLCVVASVVMLIIGFKRARARALAGEVYDPTFVPPEPSETEEYVPVFPSVDGLSPVDEENTPSEEEAVEKDAEAEEPRREEAQEETRDSGQEEEEQEESGDGEEE